MRYTNKYGLPAPLVAVIENDPYEFDGDISTTSLILPPRIYQLRKRHGEEIHEDISDNIYKLLGKNTHYILEIIKMFFSNCIREKRYYTTICGWKVGGMIDLYEQTPKILSDYKITSIGAVTRGIKPEHEQQMNINAYLMNKNGLHPERLQIVNLLRDWIKRKRNEYNYPKCQVVIQPIKLWAFSKIDKWIYDRVFLHQQNGLIPDDQLPPCTSQEMWTRPTVYAVKKKARKKALRLLDTQEKADKWIEDNKKGDSVEIRLGENVRCNEWCNVNIYCNQYLGI